MLCEIRGLEYPQMWLQEFPIKGAEARETWRNVMGSKCGEIRFDALVSRKSMDGQYKAVTANLEYVVWWRGTPRDHAKIEKLSDATDTVEALEILAERGGVAEVLLDAWKSRRTGDAVQSAYISQLREQLRKEYARYR